MTSGILVFFPVVLGWAALFMSLLGNIWCKFISFGVTGGLPSGKSGRIHYGIFLQGDHFVTSNGELVEGCVSYSDTQFFDSKWKTAQAFSIMAPVIGTIALCFVGFSMCTTPDMSALKCAGLVFVVMTLFQGLTFLYLDSNACDGAQMNANITASLGITFDDTCSLSTGANMCIASTVLWFVAGILTCVVSKQSDPDESPKADPDESPKAAPDEAEAAADPEQAAGEPEEKKAANEEEDADDGTAPQSP